MKTQVAYAIPRVSRITTPSAMLKALNKNLPYHELRVHLGRVNPRAWVKQN